MKRENRRRAAHAQAGLTAYLKASDQELDVEDALAFVVGDLRHLADVHGVDFDDVDEMARENYYEEVGDDV